MSIPEGMEQKYESAVDSLAAVDPLLAFRLSGRAELNRYADLWKTAVESWLEKHDGSEDDRRLLSSLHTVMGQTTRGSLLKSLEADLVDVAGTIDRRTRSRVKQIIAKSKEPPDADSEKELGDMIEDLIRGAMIDVKGAAARE